MTINFLALHAPRPEQLLPWALVGAMLAACGPETSASDTSTSSTTTTSTTATTTTTTGAVDPTTSTPTTSTTTTSATTDPDTCGGACTNEERTSFIPEKLDGGSSVECDVFKQNCPDGTKCAAWAEGGGESWNATHCVPIIGDKQPGEPCTAEPGKTGVDDCAKGAMCWNVDDANNGVCEQTCTGNEEMPMCSDPKQSCAAVNDGVLNVCLDTCQPLIQDCPDDELCLPISGVYLCLADDSGDAGATFDPCERTNGCDKGLVCLAPIAAPECDQQAIGCCMPMCSIADGGAACPSAGQSCVPVYEPKPPGFEDVGYCSIMR